MTWLNSIGTPRLPGKTPGPSPTNSRIPSGHFPLFISKCDMRCSLFYRTSQMLCFFFFFFVQTETHSNLRRTGPHAPQAPGPGQRGCWAHLVDHACLQLLFGETRLAPFLALTKWNRKDFQRCSGAGRAAALHPHLGHEGVLSQELLIHVNGTCMDGGMRLFTVLEMKQMDG